MNTPDACAGDFRFTDAMAALCAARNPLPAELRDAMQFLEDNGCVHRYTTSGEPFLALHANTDELNHTVFNLPRPDDFRCWTGNDDPVLAERLVPLLRTGADGSYAALWLDDQGAQKIVHLGSEGEEVGILAHTVGDFLRLLSIGYCELNWACDYDTTPAEAAVEEDWDDYPPPSTLLRRYVQERLGLTIPERASEIALPPAGTMHDHSDDPFAQWVRQVIRQ